LDRSHKVEQHLAKAVASERHLLALASLFCRYKMTTSTLAQARDHRNRHGSRRLPCQIKQSNIWHDYCSSFLLGLISCSLHMRILFVCAHFPIRSLIL
jgi:hypothetical protein